MVYGMDLWWETAAVCEWKWITFRVAIALGVRGEWMAAHYDSCSDDKDAGDKVLGKSELLILNM